MNNLKKFWVGGALNMAAGAYGAISGAVQERNARRRMAMAAEEAASPIRSQAARQRVARQEGDAQAAIDSALRAEATAAQQLAQAGGARALAGRTAGLQRATGMSTDRALQRFGDYGAQVSAAQDAAQVNQINQRLGGNLDRLARAADAGRAQMLGGIAQGIGGIAQVAGSLSKKSKDNNTDVSGNSLLGDQTDSSLEVSKRADGVPGIGSNKNANQIGSFDITGGRTQTVQDLRGATPGMKRAAQMMSEITPPRSAPDVNFERLQPPPKGSYNEPFIPQIQDPIPLEDLPIGDSLLPPYMIEPIGKGEVDEFLYTYDRGGMQPKSSDEEVDALKAMMRMVSHIKKEVGPHSLEEEVEETPGEFNHDTNPIDIVQDDEKIGEMTGGEYIFNPEQAEMLKQLSEEGDSELHDFVRNLLSKEQFNG